MKKTKLFHGWVVVAMFASWIAAVPARAFKILEGVQSPMRPSPIAFDINYTNCPMARDMLLRAAQRGLGLWENSPTSDVSLHVIGENTYDPNVLVGYRIAPVSVIFCDTQYGSRTGNSGNAAASAYYQGHITINAQSSSAGYIGTNLSEEGLAIVIAHEAGHVMGLDHPDNVDGAIMAPRAIRALALHSDDIDGITTLYPRKGMGFQDAFGCGTIADVARRGLDDDGRGGGGFPPGANPFAAGNWILVLGTCLAGAAWMKRARLAASAVSPSRAKMMGSR